jgi:hypothetical protein
LCYHIKEVYEFKPSAEVVFGARSFGPHAPPAIQLYFTGEKTLQKLLTEASEFPACREGAGFLYCDKTEFVYKMARKKSYYFLSRPPRFGKTLLVSTLEALFEGRRELFKGLWIDGSDYDWTPHPVIRLSLDSLLNDSSETMGEALADKLRLIAQDKNVEIMGSNPVSLFESLIVALWRKDDEEKKADGRDDAKRGVVVLIDDYDAPILANIANTDRSKEIMDIWAHFYTAMMEQERYLRLVFVTGVAKFAFIFYEVNLLDLTLCDEYANVCGFASSEFDSLFKGHLEAALERLKSNEAIPESATADDLKQLILERYGGYCWDRKTKVLNPWSVLSCLKKGKLENFWFGSASPSFLADLVREGRLSLDFLKGGSTVGKLLPGIDIRWIYGSDLLFQAGWLTLDVDKVPDHEYFLDFPNLEVKEALALLLLEPGGEAGDQEALKSHAGAFLASMKLKDEAGAAAAFGAFLGRAGCGLRERSEASRLKGLMRGLAMLLWEPGWEVGDQDALKRHARAFFTAIKNKDESGAAKSFGAFLGCAPYNLHEPSEASCHKAFMYGLSLAGQFIEPEMMAGGGRSEVHFLTKEGEDFVVEIKFVPAKRKKGSEPETLNGAESEPEPLSEAEEAAKEAKKAAEEAAEEAAEKAAIVREMERAVEAAWTQIEEKKFALKFKGSGRPIWKTALAVSYRTTVRFAFRKADNWILAKDESGVYRVKPIPGD